MADAFRRHDLVRTDPETWRALLAARGDLAGLPHLATWAERGWPLVVRRGAGDVAVPLGLPLPPNVGKHRIALALPADRLAAFPAPGLAAVRAAAPAAWWPTIDRLVALGQRTGVVPRPFGGLLWEAVTGLTYLSPSSDLDLFWPIVARVPAGLLDGIAAIEAEAPMRIDGEVLLPDGAGLNWRELRGATAQDAVLCKGPEGVELRPAASIADRAA